MARGRKRQMRDTPPRAEGDFSAYRVLQYHLCGQEIYAQPYPHRGVWSNGGYYFVWYAARDPADAVPLETCPRCHGRVARQTVHLPAEQFLYELAQEELALQLSTCGQLDDYDA